MIHLTQKMIQSIRVSIINRMTGELVGYFKDINNIVWNTTLYEVTDDYYDGFSIHPSHDPDCKDKYFLHDMWGGKNYKTIIYKNNKFYSTVYSTGKTGILYPIFLNLENFTVLNYQKLIKNNIPQHEDLKKYLFVIGIPSVPYFELTTLYQFKNTLEISGDILNPHCPQYKLLKLITNKSQDSIDQNIKWSFQVLPYDKSPLYRGMFKLNKSGDTDDKNKKIK